jgi:hypothetical protein
MSLFQDQNARQRQPYSIQVYVAVLNLSRQPCSETLLVFGR